jgi:SET domain-containing protein
LLIKSIISTDKLYISQSAIPDAGRGVFAKVIIKKGELIEMCPVVLIPEHDVAGLSESFLLTYFYFFGKNRERIVFALGFGSVYNHNYAPNATYKENRGGKALEFIALRDIKKDEEITVNYVQGKHKNKHPLWFSVASPENAVENG